MANDRMDGIVPSMGAKPSCREEDQAELRMAFARALEAADIEPFIQPTARGPARCHITGRPRAIRFGGLTVMPWLEKEIEEALDWIIYASAYYRPRLRLRPCQGELSRGMKSPSLCK